MKSKFIWALLALIGVFSLYLVIVFSYWVYAKDRIYPNVSVAGVNIGGKSSKEAEEILKEEVDEYLKKKIYFTSSKNKPIALKDLKIKADIEGTIASAKKIGADNPFILGRNVSVPLEFSLNEKKAFEVIAKEADKITTDVTSSKVEKLGKKIKIIDGKNGQRVNYAETRYRLGRTIAAFNDEVEIAAFLIPPTFTNKDLSQSIKEIEKYSANSLTLYGVGKDYPVSSEAIVSWAEPKTPRETLAVNFSSSGLFAPFSSDENENSLFSSELIADYLTELSAKIDRSPVNATLKIVGSKAAIRTSAKNGQKMDIEKSADNINKALMEKEGRADLVIKTTEPEISAKTLKSLGITGLVSTGYSYFWGSPANRLHNIRVGASKFNGVLVKPDENFSFIETLGPVDASTGYLPELVIKEKKTVPEYGGGMCQVSSTAFRAALNAGLPILERTPHAYPVQYYLPYGVDATVYIPKPDLVFQNDTGHYIFIQTHIDGSRLTFDFYGTKKNQTVSFSGSSTAKGAVFPVEKVSPYIYDKGKRGKNSFSAIVYRFIYNRSGKLTDKDEFVSKYDSPDKYPH